MAGSNNVLARHTSLLITRLPCQPRRLRPLTLPTIMANSTQSRVPEPQLAANRPSSPILDSEEPNEPTVAYRTAKRILWLGLECVVAFAGPLPRPVSVYPPVLSFAIPMLCSSNRYCCFLLLHLRACFAIVIVLTGGC